MKQPRRDYYELCADLTPGKVYHSARTGQYVYVLGRLPDKKPGAWVMVRPARASEVREFESRRAQVHDSGAVSRTAHGSISTVVDLRGIEPYRGWYDRDDCGWE